MMLREITEIMDRVRHNAKRNLNKLPDTTILGVFSRDTFRVDCWLLFVSLLNLCFILLHHFIMLMLIGNYIIAAGNFEQFTAVARLACC